MRIAGRALDKRGRHHALKAFWLSHLAQRAYRQGWRGLASNEGYFLPGTDANWSEAERYARVNGLGQVVRSHELRTSQQRAGDAGQMSFGDVLDQGTRVA